MKKYLVSMVFVLSLMISAQNNSSSNNNWRFGGNFGLGFGGNSAFSLLIAPQVGYSVTHNLELGANVGINYFTNKFEKSTFFNFGPYVYFSPIQNIFLSANYQYLTGSSEYKDDFLIPDNRSKINFDESAIFLGGGYQSRIGNNTFLRVGLQYNVLYDDNESVYASGLVPTFGIVSGF